MADHVCFIISNPHVREMVYDQFSESRCNIRLCETAEDKNIENSRCIVVERPVENGFTTRDYSNRGFPVIVMAERENASKILDYYLDGAFDVLDLNCRPIDLANSLGRALRQPSKNSIHDLDPLSMGFFDVLTSRERQVAKELINGKNIKQIAFKMGITVQTANRHRSRILKKAKVDNDVQLTRAVLHYRNDDEPNEFTLAGSSRIFRIDK